MLIGFVGLGRMGGPMAGRLVSAGHALVVHDLDPGTMASLEVQGARRLPSVKAVADAAEIVVLSLPTPDIAHEIALGPGGVAEGDAVKICVDLSTSGPQMAMTLARGLEGRGIAFVEAPITGGTKGAREGTLALMIAGPAAACDQVVPLLEVLGRVFPIGETPGSGQTMKLIDNLLGACAIAITGEGMAVGIKAGLDPARMIEVLNASAGRSSATQDKWPRAVLPRTFDFGVTTGLSLNDVRLCMEEADAAGVPMAVSAAVRRMLERTAARFGADSDFTAMAKLIEEGAGLNPSRAD
jgi:3-hydroxyisobutyrate dehydrogenase-like beta-hydroxyacid dehydrogenase